MTKTYALKRLLEHGELSAKQMIEITGWTHRQVWGCLQQLQKTQVVRRYPKMQWGLVDLKPFPYATNE
jgi:hypothetical protein